jgi:hypothetical protein
MPPVDPLAHFSFQGGGMKDKETGPNSPCFGRKLKAGRKIGPGTQQKEDHRQNMEPQNSYLRLMTNVMLFGCGMFGK